MTLDDRPSGGTNADTSDASLVTAMGRGDSAALGRLFQLHGRRLLVLGRQLVGPTDAQEVLHEVFLEAWRGANSYDPGRGSVLNWLLVRMRSRCLDRLKSKKRSPVVPYEGHDAAPSSEPSPERRVGWRELEGALRNLSSEHRAVLQATYFQGLTMAEAAQALGLPEGTVKSRLRAAMAALREEFKLTEVADE